MDYAKQHVNDICAAMARKNERAKAEYINLAEKLDKPKISAEQRKWQDNAHVMAKELKVSIAVVEVMQNHFQLWPVSQCKGREVYIAEGGSDDEPSSIVNA